MYKKKAKAFGAGEAEKKAEVSAEDGKNTEDASKPTASSALIRLQKDFADLELPDTVEMKVNKEDLFNFSFVIKPKDGALTLRNRSDSFNL